MKKLLQNIIKSCPLICSLFILCFHLQNGLAQGLNNSPKIDQKKWEKIAEKYDYSSIQKSPKKEKPTNNEIKIEPIQKAEKAENECKRVELAARAAEERNRKEESMWRSSEAMLHADIVQENIKLRGLQRTVSEIETGLETLRRELNS